MRELDKGRWSCGGKQRVLRLRAMKLRCAQDDTMRIGLRSAQDEVVVESGQPALQNRALLAASFVPLSSEPG
jgi:DNA-binding transcriptional regulator YbjK